MMNLEQALQWLPGARLVGDASVRVARVHTDTRTLQPGDLFLALRGDNFDANEFLAQAKEKGAVAAIAHSGLAQAGLPGLEVADTKQALIQLAAGWRAQFTLPLIAVTGSNGKTTVTQMIAAILRAYRGDAAFATQGNFNNDIGVPLTLLRLRASHQVGVVELGMNHPGEISQLAQLVKPSVALVNNAQREHLEFMATVEAVARENGQVIESLDASGTAVFPADDDYAPIWRELAGAKAIRTFASAAGVQADFSAAAHWRGQAWDVQAKTPQGSLTFQLHTAGQHNVKNALAASACALAVGVTPQAIAQGLSAFEPVKGRSRALSLQRSGQVMTLIDDTYNANPDSMRAAIDVLAALPGPRLLIVGDMGEVGDRGPEFHREVGQYAKQKGIEGLLCMGELMKHCAQEFSGSYHFDSKEALLEKALKLIYQQNSILVKGSRFMRMERIIEVLTKEFSCS